MLFDNLNLHFNAYYNYVHKDLGSVLQFSFSRFSYYSAIFTTADTLATSMSLRYDLFLLINCMQSETRY